MTQVSVKATRQEGTKLDVEWKVHHSGECQVYTLNKQFDVSHWKRKSKTRSDIIHAIILSQSKEDLQMLIEQGWDINEILKMRRFKYNHWKSRWKFPFSIMREERTALQVATEYLWQEGLRMLVCAGADTNLRPEGLDPLTLTLRKPHTDHQVEALKLLLEHGANPNGAEPASVYNSPLLLAIRVSFQKQFDTQIVDLLLQNGGDPNALRQKFPPGLPLCTVMDSLSNSLSAYWMQYGQRLQTAQKAIDYERKMTENAKLFKTLVTFGADVNLYNGPEGPLLHRLVIPFRYYNEFLPKHLSLFFEYGGDVNSGYRNMGHTVLEYAVREIGHVNNVRWLIRHGADTTHLQFHHLERHFIPRTTISLPSIVSETNNIQLVLLETGMRVSTVLQFHLSGLQERIQTYLGNVSDYEEKTLIKTIKSVFGWIKQREAEEWNNLSVRRKDTFPKYQNCQLADLLEFSDQSLDVYPEEEGDITDPSEMWQNNLNRINKILEYLTQPRTLQWWCRRCVRENLVSLHPSAVKTLPVPPRLKRFILCHEV